MLPWILPAAIGIPATFLWQRHYRRKFGELPPASREQPLAQSP